MNGKEIIKECENALLDVYFLLRIAERSVMENSDKENLKTILNLSIGTLETAWNEAKAKVASMKEATV